MTIAVRRPAAAAARDHPRHLVLACAVLGLLLGPRAPAGAVVGVALLVALAAAGAGCVRPAALGLVLGAVVLVAAVAAQARTAALDRTRLTPELGRIVSGSVTLLTAVRTDAFGGRRAVASWRGERVLLRLPRWGTAATPPGIGDIVVVRGRLRAADRTARAARAHAVLAASHVRPSGRRRGGAAGLVDAIRRRAESSLDGGLPPAEAGLLRGMVLGEDEALPGDVADDFRAAGLSHLVR
ncbi:hypothetical protein FSW04_20180 [Baekduia soli]|uniref:DUF4131 domain-containing protein n=1 Tax=Baekduia soli TaxID=496014 RepID=A0A5B8U953_9ACTN|nr:hypothetical protein [Baekduia soli]QEC49666.1 hypothetical protein FSW04_20180 [Baekduia soli]